MRGVLNLNRFEISMRLKFLLVSLKKVSTGAKSMLLRIAFYLRILSINIGAGTKWRLYENSNKT